MIICRINRSGLRTRLENAEYGDEPYGDRHLSSAPSLASEDKYGLGSCIRVEKCRIYVGVAERLKVVPC